MQELREQTRLEEIMAQMEIVQLMITILSFTMFAFFLSVEMILTSSWRKRLLTSTTSGNGSEHSSRCLFEFERIDLVPLSQISMVQRVVPDLQNFLGHTIFRTAIVESVQKSVSSAEL